MFETKSFVCVAFRFTILTSHLREHSLIPTSFTNLSDPVFQASKQATFLFLSFMRGQVAPHIPSSTRPSLLSASPKQNTSPPFIATSQRSGVAPLRLPHEKKSQHTVSKFPSKLSRIVQQVLSFSLPVQGLRSQSEHR